jgi:hypothetical protein
LSRLIKSKLSKRNDQAQAQRSSLDVFRSQTRLNLAAVTTLESLLLVQTENRIRRPLSRNVQSHG